MKKLNRVFILAAVITLMTALCGCAKKAEAVQKTDNKKVQVVASIFPEYDFLRQIGGDRIELKMLLIPGAESHSFEPTPQDIKKVEGMTPEEEEGDEPEYDEHVWTSPKNAVLIVQKLSDALCEIDSKNAAYYEQNTKSYIEKLNKLDEEFQNVVDTGVRKEIVVGDRFPFRYFVDAYGLSYYAAFPGCSTDTEASAATIAFLTDKVKTDKIPVVFHIELSNKKVCDSICEATGAKSCLLNAVHNITKDDFEAGVTYLDLMEENVKVLKEALN